MPHSPLPPRSSKVLIIEPNFTGHRWRYVQWAAQAYTEADRPCVIATAPRNADHRLSRMIAAEHRPDLEMAFLDDPPPARGVVAQLEHVPYARHHRYFAHAYRRISEWAPDPVDLVVVPYVDYFLYALPFLGSPFGDTPWIAITMRSTFHHRSVGIKAPDRRLINAVKSQLFRRAVNARGLRMLLSIDPTLLEWTNRALPRRLAEAIGYLADPFPDTPSEDPAAARSRLGLGAGPHLLVYGSITDRKGIRELVSALERMKRPPTVVVAGEQDGATRAFLNQHAPRLTPSPIVIDRFISNEMERDLFSACDAVWLGYKGHYGMSGVLVQAYRFGKPAIATSEGLIGWFCAGGELGPVLDDLSPGTIEQAIEAVFDGAHRPHPSHEAHRADRPDREYTHGHEALLARHTLDAFKRTLREASMTDTARA